MQIIKRIGITLVWIAGLVFLFAGINNNDPYLVPLRGTGNLLLVLASVAAVVVLVRRGFWRGRGWMGRLLTVLWCLPPVAVLAAHGTFEFRKHRVLQTEPALARSLGQHFIVGYTSFDEVARLAEKGLIAGVYVTRHNVAGRTAEALKAEIAALQARRRSAGLPPLIVAADQEGGIVSHLAPPLTRLPALATLADLAPEQQRAKAEAFGRIHGQELASLGVNHNFAPVLDLRPDTARNRLDFNTLIGQRAISDDPAKVAAIASAYIHGLESAGVQATVKHFPGLGRVRADTHHFSADLDTPLGELEATDWRPFREVLSASNARLMVGHVAVDAVDPERPASHSKAVIDGLIRKQWSYQGIVMTDDLVMGAIYQHDVCTAVVEALNAGVDLLLVAYDGAQFYRLFACASDAAGRNALDSAILHDSETRLRRGLIVD
ncbi:glycoside hydrolase family 3 protein [Bradyrhizobium genosp. L]|uniref:glycoside hydrolase family 3 protein n=1 Tax=Bradyrhizobium genosp. L TaxID=83637 RepID=UPI0018A2830D|nr:glycoside hydrolase family 3 protein [Bradyrhizobium genosp. L]QPF88257.1 glycoside hydrolase family 3 protein [Bradyrhizobium genosp. L]